MGKRNIIEQNAYDQWLIQRTQGWLVLGCIFIGIGFWLFGS